MSVFFFKRRYKTFPELLARWNWPEEDLLYAIIRGHVAPSVRLPENVFAVDWFEDLSRKKWSDPLIARYGENVIVEDKWYYLRPPRQTGAFDGVFELCSDQRYPEKSEFTIDNWYHLPKSISIQEMKEIAVFLDEEIERYEGHFKPVDDAKETNKPLITSERNTLLSIIAVLCNEAKLDHTATTKSAGLIQDMAQRLGIHIGKTTIRDHLKKIPEALGTRME